MSNVLLRDEAAYDRNHFRSLATEWEQHCKTAERERDEARRALERLLPYAKRFPLFARTSDLQKQRGAIDAALRAISTGERKS